MTGSAGIFTAYNDYNLRAVLAEDSGSGEAATYYRYYKPRHARLGSVVKIACGSLSGSSSATPSVLLPAFASLFTSCLFVPHLHCCLLLQYPNCPFVLTPSRLLPASALLFIYCLSVCTCICCVVDSTAATATSHLPQAMQAWSAYYIQCCAVQVKCKKA